MADYSSVMFVLLLVICCLLGYIFYRLRKAPKELELRIQEVRQELDVNFNKNFDNRALDLIKNFEESRAKMDDSEEESDGQPKYNWQLVFKDARQNLDGNKWSEDSPNALPNEPPNNLQVSTQKKNSIFAKFSSMLRRSFTGDQSQKKSKKEIGVGFSASGKMNQVTLPSTSNGLANGANA